MLSKNKYANDFHVINDIINLLFSSNYCRFNYARNNTNRLLGKYMKRFNTQSAKILKLLQGKPWVCVTEFIDLYAIDYRRRLVDLKERGHTLESRRCTQHKHPSGLKEWHLTVKVPKYQYEQTPDGSMREITLFQ